MADRASASARWRDERGKEGVEKNKRTRVYVRGKPGEVSEPRPLHGSGERTPGNKYNKGSDGANDAEWTKSGVSVEREGKMKTTEIKENEDPSRTGLGR